MLGRAIHAVMVDLLASPDFNQSDWRLFHTLACRLQPQSIADCLHQPTPLIDALGFETLEAFVTGPTKLGGLDVSPEQWAAITRAASAIELAPWLATAGYSMLSLANLQMMSTTSGNELPTSQEGIQEFLAAISPQDRVRVPLG